MTKRMTTRPHDQLSVSVE